MRLPLRSCATILLAVGLVTCAESSTSSPRPAGASHGVSAHVGFSPVFSKTAAATFERLADFGLTFDHVRVIIIRPVSDTVKDTTVAFAPGQTDLTLDLDVVVSAPGESFNAAIDYTNAQGVLFHGEGVVQSHAADQPAPAQQITVQYKGPGATIARLSVTPKTTTVVSPATATFAVAAVDSNNAAVSNPLVSWSTSDVSVATISTAGVLTPTGKRGTITVTAATPTNISDGASVSISLPPTSIVLVSGGGQTGKVGKALLQPAVVFVAASDGVAAAGASVNFGAPIGGAVGATTVLTDASGLASTSLTLTGTLGPQGFVAVLGSIGVAIGETGVAGDPASLVLVSGNNQTDTARHVLKNPLVVRAADSYGNVVPNASVAWTRIGGGTLSVPTSTTGTDGQASVTYTLGGAVGTDTIFAAVQGASAPVTFIAQALSAPAASVIVLSGGGQVTHVLQSLGAPLVIRVLDDGGNPVRSGTVAWTSTSGAVGFPTTTTDATGATSNTFTAGSLPGSASVTATIGTHSTTFSVQVLAGSAAQSVFRTGPPNGIAGSVLTPSIEVELRDQFGNLSASTSPVTVALGANPGSATLTGTLTRNAVAGVATFDDLKLDRSGTGYTLTATVVGNPLLTSSPFTIGAGAASNVGITVQPSANATSGASFTVQPVVQLQDGNTNPVAQSGVVVTAAVASGSGAVGGTTTATTDAQGQAHFSGLLINGIVGGYTLSFTAPSLVAATSTAITLAPGVPAALVFGRQPVNTVAGVAITAAPTVQVRDASGNAVPTATNSVTIAIAAGTGTAGATLSGTVTAAAVAGVATFSNLEIDRSGPGYLLTATGSGLVAGTSTALAIAPAAPASLTIVKGNNQYFPSNGSSPRESMQVVVKDAFTNPVPGVVVTFTAGGAATIGGSPSGTGTTNAAGIATQSLSFTAAGSGTGTASAAGLTSVVFTAVEANQGNWDTACKATTVGAVYCWGDGSYGTIGNGVAQSITLPTAVSGGLQFVNFTASYASHECGIVAGGAAYCWGRNTFGELGDNSTTDRSSPVPVAGGHAFTSLALASYSTCGLATGGQMYCWGSTGGGNLGDGDDGTIRAVPTLVSTGGRVFTKIALLDDYICGIEASGVLSCWGQTPTGTVTTPTTVPSVALVSLTAGFYHVCGLTSSGAGYCFGTNNGTGAMGNGSLSPNSAPTPIVGGLTFAEIRAYAYSTCGRTTTNVLYCWGQDSNFGPLVGDGTQGTDRSVPTAVLGGISFGSIDGGGISFSCATSTAGQPFCWGNSSLGNSSVGSSSTPVPVQWVQGTAGVATSIVKQGGDNTAGTVGGSPVSPPPSVLVRDYAGNPVVGITVTFAVESGGGTLTTTTAVTDASGIATASSWVLGAGTNTLSATILGVGQVVFTATGVAGLH